MRRIEELVLGLPSVNRFRCGKFMGLMVVNDEVVFAGGLRGEIEKWQSSHFHVRAQIGQLGEDARLNTGRTSNQEHSREMRVEVDF